MSNGRWADFSWEGNCRSVIALPMCHRLNDRNGLRKGNEHPPMLFREA